MDPNFAMQSILLHETLRQQRQNMDNLNRMLEMDNQRMLREQQMRREQAEQAREEELREIYYGDK